MDTVTDKYGLKFVQKPDWDNDIVRCIGNTGMYEGGMLKFVREVYPQLNADFYDIGAAFGYFAIHASKVAPANRSVLSFEPHPAHFKSLEENIAINNCLNIIPHNVALSNEIDSYEVNNYKRDAGVCLNESDGDTPKVMIETELLSSYDLGRARVLKLDTELTELDILQGSEDFIRSTLTRAIAIEFVPNVNYRLNIYNFLRQNFEFIYILDEDCGKVVIPDHFSPFLANDILRSTAMNVVFTKEAIP